MKKNKSFLFAILSVLSLSALAGCNNKPIEEESQEPKPLEIGDTVKEWTSSKDLEVSPINVTSVNNGEVIVNNDFGREDDSSLYCDVKTSSYIGSDSSLIENKYFLERDAKNGDIISLWFYVEEDSNLASLQLQVFPISNNNPIKSTTFNITDESLNEWHRLSVSFDTLETLGSIRLYYKPVSTAYSATFYVDDINITLGEETVKTKYVSNDESLYKTYEDYFKVGSCMSINQVGNTEFRKIAKDNFNSITAENEGKPEQILDQQACQKLAREDQSAVAIKTTPFERIYNFCEANHIKVRHHTFVWYSQTPAWFFKVGYNQNGANVSKDVMLGRMENFIKVTLETINERWPGLVYAIDVANEAVDNGATRSNDNMWYTVVGKDFVYYAFKFASEYKEEDQKLYYNDYSFDYNTNNCKYAVNTLLKQAIEEELIDGVGIQGHIDSGSNLDVLINDAKMIKERGLECQITELDITTNGTSTAELNKQKKAYKDLLTKVLQNNAEEKTNITAVVVWGLTDDTSWKRNQNPLLFTSEYAKKPAYYGFLEAIECMQTAEEEVE